MTTPIFNITEIQENQNNKFEVANAAFRSLEALGAGAAETATLNAPDGNEFEGAIYIVGDTATGAWSSFDNQLTQYINNGWEFYTVSEGFSIYVKDASSFMVYDGTNWIDYQDAYSTTAIADKRKWTDGKTVQEQVLTFSNVTLGSYQTIGSIASVDTWIGCDMVFEDTEVVFGNLGDGTGANDVVYRVNGSNVEVSIGSSRNATHEGHVIVRYTLV